MLLCGIFEKVERAPLRAIRTQRTRNRVARHIDEIREAKVPPFDEVKPQLQQRMQAAYLDKYFRELRAKNGV